MLTQRTNAGPSHRAWRRLSEFEVGHPHFRPKRNPVPPNAAFPTAAPGGIALQMLAWNLRDTAIVLANKTWNTPYVLFTIGGNSQFTPFGASSAINKTPILTNIASATGLLPSPQSFLATHIRQIIRADIYQADLLNLLYSTYYSFQASDQNLLYFEGPGAVCPSGNTSPFVGNTGSVYTGTILGAGWPVNTNVASLRSGLVDPTTGKPDMGYAITENKQFKFILDPTQTTFIADATGSGGWTTTATGSTGGTGIEVGVELQGVLARSLAG